LSTSERLVESGTCWRTAPSYSRSASRVISAAAGLSPQEEARDDLDACAIVDWRSSALCNGGITGGGINRSGGVCGDVGAAIAGESSLGSLV